MRRALPPIEIQYWEISDLGSATDAPNAKHEVSGLYEDTRDAILEDKEEPEETAGQCWNTNEAQESIVAV